MPASFRAPFVLLPLLFLSFLLVAAGPVSVPVNTTRTVVDPTTAAIVNVGPCPACPTCARTCGSSSTDVAIVAVIGILVGWFITGLFKQSRKERKTRLQLQDQLHEIQRQHSEIVIALERPSRVLAVPRRLDDDEFDLGSDQEGGWELGNQWAHQCKSSKVAQS